LRRYPRIRGSAGRCAGLGAAVLVEHNIMPDSVEVSEAFANANLAKSTLQMERAACGICVHDLGLQGPVFFVFGGGDQISEERAAEAIPCAASFT